MKDLLAAKRCLAPATLWAVMAATGLFGMEGCTPENVPVESSAMVEAEDGLAPHFVKSLMGPAPISPLAGDTVRSGGPADASEGGAQSTLRDDAGLTTASDWTIQLKVATTVLKPNASGCLVASSTTLPAGQQLKAVASDGRYFLIDEAGSCVPAANVTELSKPSPMPTGRVGEIAYNTNRYSYGSNGCPVQGEALAELTTVEALARSYDPNYHGYVVIDRGLSLAPVRHVNAEGWVYPWHASVQLVKPVNGGFIVGGAVLVGPNTLLTARHMKVDSSWCYSREPNTGVAWYAGDAECNNIAGPAQEAPDGVDAALVTLIQPEGAPYAQLRTSALSPGEAFYAAKWSYLHQNAFADSSVLEVDNDNAFCQRWPKASSFISKDPILQGGDSGGPAWVGDMLVGLVHGEKCYKGMEKIVWQQSGEPAAQVLVHVPSLVDFIEAGL